MISTPELAVVAVAEAEAVEAVVAAAAVVVGAQVAVAVVEAGVQPNLPLGLPRARLSTRLVTSS